MKKYFPFASPVFPDEEQTRLANLLFRLLWPWMLTVTVFGGILAVVLLPANTVRWIAIVAAVDGAGITSLALTSQGRVRLASVLFIFQFWLIISVFALTAGGIHAPAVTAYLLIIFAAGILLGERGGFVTAILCILTGLVFVYLENEGMLPVSSVQHTPVTLWLSHSMYAFLIFVLMHLAGRDIGNALQRANQELAQRKRTQEALQANEERLRRITDNMLDLISQIDTEGILCYVSSSHTAVLGYTPRELSGQLVMNFVHPEDVARIEAAARQIIEGTLLNPVEFRFRHADGHYVWLESVGNSIFDERRQRIGTVFAARDITERKRAEDARRRSEQLYRTIAENFPNGAIVLFDHDLRYFLAEGRELEEVGLRKERMIGKTIWEVFPAETCQFIESDYRKALAGKSVVSEVPYQNRIYQVHHLPIKDEQGNVVAGMVMTQNITDRSRAEEKEKEYSRRITNILESVSDAFVSLDTNWHYTYMNKKAGEIFSRKPEEMIGKHIWTEFPEGVGQVFYRAYYKAVETQRFQFLEEYYPPYNRWFENRIYPSKDGLSIFFHDVTDRKRAEKQVLESEKRLRMLVDGTQALLFTTDRRGRLTYLNQAASDVLGMSSDQLLDKQDISDRKRAEDALRESEDRYRRLVELSPDGIAVHAQGKFVFVNSAAAKLLGTTVPGQLIGFPILDTVHPDYRDIVRERQRQMREEKVPAALIEEKLVGLNGAITDVEVTAVPFRYQGQEAVQVVFRDITERKRAEEALRVSEEKFSKAFRSSPDSVTISSLNDGVLIEINDGFERVFGYSREEALGHSSLDLNLYDNPEDRKRVQQLIRQNGRVQNLELTGRRKSGDILIGELSAEMMEMDKQVYLVTIVRDITNQKAAEKAVHKSEERYRRIVETANEGIWLIDKDSRTSFVNARMAVMLGYTVTEMMGKSLFDFMDEEGQTISARNVERRKQGIAEQHDFKFKRKDGMDLWATLATNPVLDEHGEYAGALAMVADITARKHAEEKLQLSYGQLRLLTTHLETIREEERKAIAREIHDELGQILTAVKMDLTILSRAADEGTLAEVRAKLRNDIRDDIALVDKSIKSVRRIASELRPEVLDELGIKSAIEWQANEFQTRTSIPCECVANFDEIEMSPEVSIALYRIVQEALTNVTRHADATVVNIDLRKAPDFLTITIRDNGKGYSLRGTAKKKSLGLIGMRERSILLGGEFTIEGQRGKGTTVTVRVPLM
ncbi:MAG: PAS domain S-box protein [Ignavibacteriae bacterium]|nr:PAS domain S-box protein [Ignavibacteriota bacterium]